MSFPSIKITYNKQQTKRNKQRKESDSLLAYLKCIFSLKYKERASAFTSKASITVEAAVSVSFFFLAVMCVACIFEIMVLQMNVKSALHSAGKEIAMEAYLNPILFTDSLEKEIVNTIGAERLDRSFIIGGSNGINCSGSKTYSGSTVMDLCAYYEIQIPIAGFKLPVIGREEIIRIKGWSGAEERYISNAKNEVVYVTDYGIVYHSDLSCTYLELSIKAVPYVQVEELRNSGGGKYYACELCGKHAENQTNVFITEQGDRFHSTLECSGLSRNVYAMPLSEVYGLGGCSKCVK